MPTGGIFASFRIVSVASRRESPSEPAACFLRSFISRGSPVSQRSTGEAARVRRCSGGMGQRIAAVATGLPATARPDRVLSKQ